MSEQDPPRLREPGAADPELQRMLEAGHHDLPDDARLAAMTAGLQRLLDSPGGGDDGGPPAAPAQPTPPIPVTPLKALYLAGSLALIAGGAILPFGLLGARASSDAVRAPSPAASSPSSVTARATPPTAAASASSRAAVLVPAASASAARNPVKVVEPIPQPDLAVETHESQSVEVTENDSGAPATAASSALSNTTTGAADSSGTSSLTPPAIAEAATETEAQLLRRAQDSLAVNPGAALALTQEHARRFPAGILGQEREVIAILALERLGRTVEARSRASAFAAQFPRSAHLPRLAHLLAASP